jgi:hypothetical protein
MANTPQQRTAPQASTAEAKERSQDIAKSAEEAEAKQLDETIPGGEYIVNGVRVNARGRKIGSKEEFQPLPDELDDPNAEEEED